MCIRDRFQSVPNGFQASATEPRKDADRFFDACEFVALAYAGGIEGVCEQDDAKAVHYYEILLEVCMSVLNRKRFKSEDDHYIFLCWEKLADAYSTGRGCTPNHEKAKEYYKYAVAAAMGEGSDDAENDVPKQTRIPGKMCIRDRFQPAYPKIPGSSPKKERKPVCQCF